MVLDWLKRQAKYGPYVYGPTIASVLPAAWLFIQFIGAPRLALVIAAVPIIGTYLFFGGFADYRRRTFVKDTPTSTARSVAMGPVEVKGTAQPEDSVFTSAFSGEDCVLYKYEVEEYRRQGKHSSWVTINSGIKSDLFRVRDETGSVLVDPQGAELKLPRDNRIHVDGGDKPPEAVQQFIERNPTVDSEAHSFDAKVFTVPYGNDRRYSEWFIELDRPIYVYGTAMTHHAGTGDEIVINRDENTPMFMISDTSEKAVLDRMLKTVIGKLLAGAALLILTAVLLYHTTWPLF